MPPPPPPSPPSGPPRGTFFSRLKLTMPAPPLPAWISMRASSMNFTESEAVEIKKPYRADRAFGEKLLLSRHHADRLLVVRPLEAELDFAVHLCEQSVVLADTDIVPGMNTGTALANDDAARGYDLPAETLYAETLGLRIAAVAGTAAGFLMCHGLPFSSKGSLYAAEMPVISISV